MQRLLDELERLALPDAWIGAGAVRSAYWAVRHGRDPEAVGGDVDVVYFDPHRAPEDDARIQEELARRWPIAWEVVNQAHVHRWYAWLQGPLTSTAHAVSLWPETATCVAARRACGAIELLAPHGLDDLLALRWRANPACPDPTAFARRLEQKRVRELWPQVTIG